GSGRTRREMLPVLICPIVVTEIWAQAREECGFAAETYSDGLLSRGRPGETRGNRTDIAARTGAGDGRGAPLHEPYVGADQADSVQQPRRFRLAFHRNAGQPGSARPGCDCRSAWSRQFRR